MKQKITLDFLKRKSRSGVALLGLLLGTMGISNESSAQCTNFTQYPSGTINLPTSIGQTVTATTCQYAAEYYVTNSTVPGYTYQFIGRPSGYYITVRSGSYNGTAVASGTTPVTWTATSAMPLYVHLNTSSSCGTQTGICLTTQVSRVNPPPCTGQPTAGAPTASQTAFNCQGLPTLNLPSATIGGSMEYQWQSRPVGGTTWTNLGSVLTTTPEYTLTTPITQNTEFRAWVKCTPSNLSDTSTTVTVTITKTQITPAATTALCTPPNDQPLTITAPALPDTLFKENFEGTGHSFTTTNVNGTWSVKNSPYYWSWWGGNISSPDNSKYLLNEETTYAYLSTFNEATSITFSTVGYTSATLRFQHYLYYNYQNFSYVEISTNGGSSWTQIASYSSGQGSISNFATVTIPLGSTYMNQANCKIRFKTAPYYLHVWAIDNINIVGVHPPLAYSWTATPSTGAGLPSSAGTPSLGNTSIVANPSPGSYTYTAAITGLAGGCDASKSVIINVGPKPTATISGTTTICDGQTANVAINIPTGTPPFNLSYTDGSQVYNLTNVTNSVVNIPVNPSNTLTYTLTSLSDPVCTAGSTQMTGSAVVTVNPRPTAAMNNQSYTICDGTTAYLPVVFTGTPPFDIVYTDGTNTFTETGIATTNYQMPVPTLTGTTVYYITSVVDANGCQAMPGDITGNGTVTSNVRPTGVITGNPTICNGNLGTLQVGFTGTPPYSFTYGDGGSFNYTVSNIYNNPYTLIVAPTTTATYSLIDVTDVNCSTIPIDLSGSSVVTVNQRPTATLSGTGQTICHGDQVNLSVSFTGTPPYSFGYTNGNSSQLVSGINSPTYNFVVTPEATGTYQVTGLSDLNCVSQLSDLSGQIPVTVRHPEATISGTQVSCEGGTSPIVVDFSGAGLTAPYTFTYNDGSANTTVTTSSDPYLMTVGNVASTTYSLVSFNDANCAGDLNGSAVLTVNPAGGWRGMISSDWHDAANWCGVVPTATTEVLIPGTSPNMPVLASGAGYCDTMIILPGASVTVNSGANLNIYGNLDNNGTLNWTNGHINFKGAQPQYADGFSAQNVTIENLSGVHTTGDMVVNGLLVLNGNLYLDSSDLILANGATTIGQAFNKYVHTNSSGRMVRDVSSGPILFPVGNSAYNPLTLTNDGIPDKFSVGVVDAVYQDGYGLSPEQVDFPVVARSWMIEEAVSGGSNVTIKAQWNAGEEWNFFDRQHAFIRHWDGTEWHYNDSITAPPSQGSAPYTITEGGFTSFSPFTVGGWRLWPLAVELLDFTAVLSGANNALVSWSVSQSSEAQLFEVERSADGEHYTKVGELKAVKDKTAYSTTDRDLSIGRNYYRLKVTDNSGRTDYSKTAVVITKGGGVEVVTLAPNPVTGTGVAMISTDNATSAEVRIMDAVGHVLYKGTHELSTGLNKVSLEMGNLAPGNYTLHVLTNTGNATPVKFTKL